MGTPRNIHYCRFNYQDAPDESLPANRYPTNQEMAEFLGVDSKDFPTIEEFRPEDPCMGCYSGDFSFLELRFKSVCAKLFK